MKHQKFPANQTEAKIHHTSLQNLFQVQDGNQEKSNHLSKILNYKMRFDFYHIYHESKHQYFTTN